MANTLLKPLFISGLLLMLLALFLLLPGRSLWLGFGAVFLILLGFSLIVPQLVTWGSRAAAPLLGGLFGLFGRMAARGVRASLSRTGVAIAALSIAVSATVGVGVMVGSFRLSVEQWLETTLQGDIYVAPATQSGGTVVRLDPSLLRDIAALPGIAEVSQGRSIDAYSGNDISRVFAIEMASRSYAGIGLLQGEPVRVWQAFRTDQAVLISEPYAFRHRLGPGDTLALDTDRGQQRFRVLGVYRDYGSEQGVVMMRMSLYRQYWRDQGVYSIGLYLQPGADISETMAAVRTLAKDRQYVRVRANRELREASMETFDRTFAITHVLRLLVVGVAFVGILSALLALQLEKAREYAILRATGVSPGQLWGLVSAQTGFMGLLAAGLAIPLGLVLGALLIHVINRRAFGWSMDMVIPGAVLWEAVLLALVAALLAGLYPAWRMSRAMPAVALRGE